jgi:hypothetical protein
MDTEVMILSWREERENCTKDASQHGAGCESRGGIDGICVNQIVGDSKVDEYHACSKGPTGCNTCNGRDGREIGPGKPKELEGKLAEELLLGKSATHRQWNKHAAYHSGNHSGFRRCFSCRRYPPVLEVHPYGAHHASNHAYCYANEC